MGEVIKLRDVKLPDAEPVKGTTIMFCHNPGDGAHVITLVAHRDIENGLWTVSGDFKRRYWATMQQKFPAIREGAWVRMTAEGL